MREIDLGIRRVVVLVTVGLRLGLLLCSQFLGLSRRLLVISNRDSKEKEKEKEKEEEEVGDQLQHRIDRTPASRT